MISDEEVDEDLKEYVDVDPKKLAWEATIQDLSDRLERRQSENTFEGVREQKLYHGLKCTSITSLPGKYADVCFCGETKEYLLFEPPLFMHRYSITGKNLEPSFPVSKEMIFTKMLWCSGVNFLVGIIPNRETIFLLSAKCFLYEMFNNEFRITSIFYEPDIADLIAVGSTRVLRCHLGNKEQPVITKKYLTFLDIYVKGAWKFEYSALIPKYTSMLRLVGSYLTTIYILNLEGCVRDDEGLPVKFLVKRPNATSAPITALQFIPSNSWIVAGDNKGNVVAYNLDMECVFSYTETDENPIKWVLVHPAMIAFVTCSKNYKMQVWNCHLRDKMECFTETGEYWSVAVNEMSSTIALLGPKLSYYNMQKLYTFFAPLTAPPRYIMSTTNPMYPTRVLVAGEDNSIQILSSRQGVQVNVQILPKERVKVVFMAYSANAHRMYTIILDTGEILISSTLTRPMTFKTIWLCDDCRVTAIVTYEYFDEIRDKHGHPQNPRIFYANCTRIFLGREDGQIACLSSNKAHRTSILPGHDGAISKMLSSHISRQVVTIGLDKCIKVWRVYPDIVEPLALHYVIYFLVSVTRIACMGVTLCTTSSTEKATNHQLIMENLKERVRLEHSASQDHQDFISDMASSEMLELCVTTSRDKTIRVWDSQNMLLKLIDLNLWAMRVGFSSLRGDIVLGAGTHLYRISYENYLSSKYRAKIRIDRIPLEEEEFGEEEDTEYKIYEDTVDRNLMLHPTLSSPIGPTGGSEEAPRLDSLIQEQNCAHFHYRDEDINNIRTATKIAKKLFENKCLMDREVWQKHVESFFPRMDEIDYPTYDIWELEHQFSQYKKTFNDFAIYRMFLGSKTKIDSSQDFTEYVKNSGLLLFGFLPNSVLYMTEEEKAKRSPRVRKIVPKSDDDDEAELHKPFKYRYPAEFLPQEEDEEDAADDILISLSMMDTFADDDDDNDKDASSDNTSQGDADV